MADTWEGVKSAFGSFGDRLQGAVKYGPAGLLMDKQQQDILGSYYDEYLAPVLRPAERITEAPGVLRDITAGVISDVAQPPARMPGDTDQSYGGALDYFKLARQGVGDYGQDQGVMADIAGALGLGPETTQRGGVGEDIINATFGKYEKPPEGEPRPWTDYLEVPARVGGAFALEQITDPGNILGMGVAAKGIKTAKTLGKGMAAQEAIAAGAGTDTLMDVMRGVADVAPGLEKSLAEYQQYRKVAEPLNALGDINDAVQAARETERSYQETGLSPETLGAATLAAITGLDVAGSAHDVVETGQNIYAKITDPAGMPRAETKQEQMLVDGFKALIQEGTLSPEDAAKAHAAFKGHNFAEEVPVEDTAEPDQMMELTPALAAQPKKPYTERKFPVHQAVKVTLEDGTSFYDFIDGLNQGHAMQRAKANWDGATVEPATVTEANKGIELDNLKHEALMKDLAEPGRRLINESDTIKRAAPKQPGDRRAQQVQAERAKIQARKALLEQKTIEAYDEVDPVEREFVAAEIALNDATQKYNRMRNAAITPEDINKADAYYRAEVLPRSAKHDTSRKKYKEVRNKATSLEKHVEAAEYQLRRTEELKPLTQQEREPIYQSIRKDEVLRKVQIDLKEAIDAWNAGNVDPMNNLAQETADLNLPNGRQVLHDITRNNSQWQDVQNLVKQMAERRLANTSADAPIKALEQGKEQQAAFPNRFGRKPGAIAEKMPLGKPWRDMIHPGALKGLEKHDIKISPEAGWVGGGAFNAAFYVGDDANGNQYILRKQILGRKEDITSGDKARWKTMIPQNNPAVVPYYGTFFADEKDERGEDVVVGYDLTKRIKTPLQLGFTGEQTEAAGDLLDAYLKKNNIIANDLHRFNIGFVPDPRGMFEGSDGQRYRPQAFDLGTSNYAQAVNRAAPSEVMALVSESQITPEAATYTAEQILSDADTDSQDVKVNGKDSSPEWEAFERRINEGREKSKKAGIEPLWKIRTDLMKKGFVNLTGRTLGNENIKKELALALRVTRQPFEVGQVVAIKHIKGKATIVYHRAFTSAKAKMFNSGDPAYKAALQEADAHVDAGKADFYFSTHNHAGDKAEPSQPDVDSVAESTHELGPGYLGEIIIDYNTWGHIPSDKSYKAKGDNWEPVPASNFKYQKLGLLEADDPIIPSGGTDAYSIDVIKGLTKSFWDPKSIARFAKGTVTSESIAAIGISGDGIVHQILKIPMETFKNSTTRELHDMLEFEASQAGVMNWAIVSEVDPQSNDHARVWHKAESLRLQESVGGSINFWNGSSRFTDFNLANKKRFVRKGETQRVAAMGKTPEERMKALEEANDFVLRKLLEFNDSRANRPDIKEDAVEEGLLQGELAQKEVGPPDVTLKPGQGGPGPINVKYNLQGMEDSQLRREIGDMLAQKGLDRQAPGPTQTEIEEGYQELLSHMSADDAHSAAEFISTKDGQVAAFERFNYYRDALRLRDAAWADFQQTKDGGDKATQDAARVDLVKAETLLQAARKDFANLKTTVGRMLNFLKELKDAETDPELNRVGALMSALRRRGVSKDKIDALMKLYNDNPAEFGKAVEKSMEPSWLKAFLQFWKAGLVSGPPTRLANIGSNTLFRGIVDMTNNIFTPAVDIIRTKTIGGQQERFFGETAASLLAYQQQFPMAMRQWLKDKGGFTFQDITTLEGGNADIKGEGALQQKLGKLAGAKGKAFADISDMAFKGLNVDDTFAKHMAAAQAAYRYAYREARKEGKSHHEAMETFATTAQEILAGLKDPESPEYKKHANVIQNVILKRAKAETFQEDMHELAKSGETFLRKYPALQLIIPFYVTPVNILKKTLEYTPIYLLRKGGLRDLFAKYEAGKISGDEAEELAKAMMGVYIAGAVATIAAFGGVTGGGPGDPKKQEELKKTGWQPYSFKVGDTYYSYQRLEPIAGVVGIAADMAEAAEAGAFGKDALTSDKGQAAMVALMASIFDNMTSKTFLAGLEGLFTAYHDPKRYLGRYVRQMEASLIPNIIGRTAQAIDPNFRDTSQRWLDPAKAKIPFLSKTLPAQTTASGQERLRPGSAASRFLNPLVASKEVKGGAANLSKELVRINYLPTIPKTFQTIGGKKVVLTSQEIAWLKEAKAKAQKDAIRTVRDPSYLRLPDNEQDPKYRLGMATKRDVLEKIYRRHRKVVQDRINMRVRERAMKAS